MPIEHSKRVTESLQALQAKEVRFNDLEGVGCGCWAYASVGKRRS